MDVAVWVSTGLYLFTLTIPFIMLLVVPRNRSPTSAIAWLLLIALLPPVGFIVFLVLGNRRLPRQRRKRQATIDDILGRQFRETWSALDDVSDLKPKVPRHVQPYVHLNENLGGMPAYGGNRVEVLSDYDGMLDQLVRDVRTARTSVHLEFYILVMDHATERLFQAMEEAVQRGVAVRVLFDHLGSRSFPRHVTMQRRMTEAGIQWRRLLPVLPFDGEYARPDLRNHRKLATIDGRIGYVGSQNLIDKGYLVPGSEREGYRYLEVMVRTTGPVVHQLDAVFRADWYAESRQVLPAPRNQPTAEERGPSLCQVLPSGPGHPHENNLRLFNALVYGARQRIVLVNPYFVPDESLVMAITSAAQRGVEVTLITCEQGNHRLLQHAQRSYYEQLLRAGVHVFRHPHPEILHSKFMAIDDDLAVVGSSNLDMRSFHLNMEVSLLVHDVQVTADLNELALSYLERAEPVELAQWVHRPVVGRWVDSVARLTAALQ